MLNPQVAALLAQMAQLPPLDLNTVTPEQWRQRDRAMPDLPPPAVGEVRDLILPLAGREVPARLYRPLGASGTLPLVVFYHGGGWVVCSIDTHDALCRALANAAGAAVLSVGYRLAPETPFPGPLDDCHDALVWAHDHAAALNIDPARLAVAGDSAGGNLAGAVALRLRDRGGPALRHQLLIYPVIDCDFTLPSYAENGGGDFFLSTGAMQWFWRHYLGTIPAAPVDGATLLRSPDLTGLPPATLIMAQYDPLRDEGLAYADALRAAGNAVHAEVAPGMIHGFFSMFQIVSDAVPFIESAGARLRGDFG